MTLPAYPGRDTPRSYVGTEVPAECPQGHRVYIPVFSFAETVKGACPKCNDVVEFTYWREESISTTPDKPSEPPTREEIHGN
jgi:hypothetical protein